MRCIREGTHFKPTEEVAEALRLQQMGSKRLSFGGEARGLGRRMSHTGRISFNGEGPI